MAIPRLDMKVISDVFGGVTCVGKHINIRAVEAWPDPITRLLKESGVALPGIELCVSHGSVKAIGIVVQCYGDAGEIAQSIVTLVSVCIHPGFAIIRRQICKERKCLWLYHGRCSCFAAASRLTCVPVASL
jgi:hypothetical protein